MARIANDTNKPVLAVTVMGGVAHYSDAGYEVLSGSQPRLIGAHSKQAK